MTVKRILSALAVLGALLGAGAGSAGAASAATTVPATHFYV